MIRMVAKSKLSLTALFLWCRLPAYLSAEREGFEPPEPLSSTVFKTAAIDHSAISPFSKSGAKEQLFFGLAKEFGRFFFEQ